MDMEEIIVRKRDGKELTEREIRYFVKGFTDGSIPDYQMSALLMAVYFNGLSRRETFVLTDAMEHSGDVVDLSGIPGTTVDKHSTGGVGDKTTLVTAPLAAALGVSVAKMSGRGLGFSGGTIDKLESIPGFRTELSREEFFDQVRRIGIAVIGQSGNLTPADKKMYALRDVTGTVESRGLIASSIMSKKLAAGSSAIVLDVKCGRGAFMKDEESAKALADIMCSIGRDAGRKTIAVITAMEEPLGLAVGNALEVREAVETLKGKGPDDITGLSVFLAGMMAFAGGKADSPEDGAERAHRALVNGEGLGKLRAMVLAQGGDPAAVDDPEKLPTAPAVRTISAERSGIVQAVDAERIGIASRMTGAGREKKGDPVDPAAGIVLSGKKTGCRVESGDVLATLYGSDDARLAQAAEEARKAFVIDDGAADPGPLIREVVGLGQ